MDLFIILNIGIITRLSSVFNTLSINSMKSSPFKISYFFLSKVLKKDSQKHKISLFIIPYCYNFGKQGLILSRFFRLFQCLFIIGAKCPISRRFSKKYIDFLLFLAPFILKYKSYLLFLYS
ncbi:hypothetical protein IMG5_073130 [Ichthyophthirius multifiliis]|uniref:Uncharacterized protein n=1 Tax=Ichthyophthirius multifiliis TaxID=5932 RepID=G0QPZ1_ICHMU|nr:hypothetical protein IMG5_073130 [Ichthyophthirius multifiliis]EGR32718.1 hypothetical protein IMG5_073130 [Ichthyophthirius multifiliis]|eukprot:XP_004036704.1 hypothetical protein IMG5_073130 [Ichthyophthirius multifiliis]